MFGRLSATLLLMRIEPMDSMSMFQNHMLLARPLPGLGRSHPFLPGFPSLENRPVLYPAPSSVDYYGFQSASARVLVGLTSSQHTVAMSPGVVLHSSHTWLRGVRTALTACCSFGGALMYAALMIAGADKASYSLFPIWGCFSRTSPRLFWILAQLCSSMQCFCILHVVPHIYYEALPWLSLSMHSNTNTGEVSIAK